MSKGAETTSAEFTTNDFPEGATPLFAIFGGSKVESPSQLPSYSDDPEALSFFIPQNKGPQVGNITGGCFPAVAAIENNAAKFHNVFGLLEVKFSGDDTNIEKIVLHDLAGNALWGSCEVTISIDNEGKTVFGEVEVTNTESGANTISMTLSEAQSLNGKSVYFPVPAGALDDGFSIVLYDEKGAAYSFLQKVTGTQAVERSNVLYVSASVSEKSEAYDELARGYYKSLFVNAGTNLDKHFAATYSQDDGGSGIPAIGSGSLGLQNDYEYFASNQNAQLQQEDFLKQSDVFVGSEEDRNGVLLYPDGSPRFRLVYCNGGKSEYHGKALTRTGRDRFHDFFYNGGSYSGSCAGSFLASTYVNVNSTTNKPINRYKGDDESGNFTFGIFPGLLRHTNLPSDMDIYDPIYTDMEVLSDTKSKIKGISGYSDDKYGILVGVKISKYVREETTTLYLRDVNHHGGSFLPIDKSDYAETNNEINGIECLMKYAYSETRIGDEIFEHQDKEYYREDNIEGNGRFNTNKGAVKRNGEVSTWAYKNPDGHTGRAVCTGSHPEATNRDCDIQYTAFMFQYAMDGNGAARVKQPDLQFGETRTMNEQPVTYENPATSYAGIGDRQYHHFKFVTSSDTKDFVLRLDSQYDKNSGIDLYLGLRQQKSEDVKDFAWLSEADYTLCNKGGQKELHIKNLPAGIWYVSVFCATKVEADVTESFPKYFKYSGKTEVLNGIPYSIKIFTGYSGSSSSGTYGDQGTLIMDD